MKMFSGCLKEGTGPKLGKVALSGQWSTLEVVRVQISAETEAMAMEKYRQKQHRKKKTLIRPQGDYAAPNY